MYFFAAFILRTILPSQVTSTSLVSGVGICISSSYGLVALLRLFVTPNGFRWSKFKLGRFTKFFYAAAAFFNAIRFREFPPDRNCFLRGHADLIGFSSVRMAGRGDLGFIHHLRDLELVAHSRG